VDGGKLKKVGIAYGSFKLFDKTKVIETVSFTLGDISSNLAEYKSFRLAVEWCLANDIDDVTFESDSAVVVNQVKGNWKCNYDHLREERDLIRELLKSFTQYQIVKVDNRYVKGVLGH